MYIYKCMCVCVYTSTYTSEKYMLAYMGVKSTGFRNKPTRFKSQFCCSPAM